jgi:hypothetical protein
MKKLTLIVSVLMVLLILVAGPMTALAQDDDETEASHPKSFWEGSLAIVAPRIAPVGEEISMTVFLRANQEPFPGAGVWALTKERAEVLRKELATLREGNNLASAATDLESIVSVHGIFIGRTGEDGRLYHAFDEAGHYTLAAVKKHYFPGFTGINVGMRPRGLGIDAPRRAPVDEDVTITVFQRMTEETVEGAGIWALSREKVEVLREDMKALREDTSVAAEERDYESLVDIHGDFLGRTDEDGQLIHAFAEAGSYLLVAVKRGYVPGLSPIGVGIEPKAIGLHAPRRALIGQDVTITSFQRGTQDPVEGTGIWALSREEAEVLRQEMTAMREDASIAAEDKDYESLADIHGNFLGRTDEDGELSVAFSSGGIYLLVGVKKGYFPGATAIGVHEMPAPTPVPPQPFAEPPAPELGPEPEPEEEVVK